MRLSWNEIRVRAKSFADAWADAAYEKGETQSFYNALFHVFGKSRRAVATRASFGVDPIMGHNGS